MGSPRLMMLFQSPIVWKSSALGRTVSTSSTALSPNIPLLGFQFSAPLRIFWEVLALILLCRLLPHSPEFAGT